MNKIDHILRNLIVLILLILFSTYVVAQLEAPELVLQVGHSRGVRVVALSPDDKIIASGSSDGLIKLWNAASGKLLHNLIGHSRGINLLAFSPNGNILASGGSNDQTVRIWDIESGSLVKTLPGYPKPVEAITFSQNGKNLISASSDLTIKVWDMVFQELIKNIDGHRYWFSNMALSPDGKVLATGTRLYSEDEQFDEQYEVRQRETVIRLWDVATGRLLTELKADSLSYELFFSPDGKTLAIVRIDNIELWDMRTLRLKKTLQTPDTTFMRGQFLIFLPDGKSLLSSGDWFDKSFRIWDITSGAVKRSWPNNSQDVSSMTLSSDGKTLVSAGWRDESIKIWDMATGALRDTLGRSVSPVSAMALSPNGKTLATAYDDNTIKIGCRFHFT